MSRLITYLETQLLKQQIPVKYYTEATAETIGAYAPDGVIWAAGGAAKTAAVDGGGLPNVYAAEDALMNRCYVGDRVLVVGGGMTGVEAALHLDNIGHEVICAARAFPAKPGFKMNDDLLKDLMTASKVRFIPKARLQRIEGDVFGCKAYLTVGEEEQIIQCDTVLLAVGDTPVEVPQLNVPVTVIGDASKGGKIMDAVHSAWHAVKNL